MRTPNQLHSICAGYSSHLTDLWRLEVGHTVTADRHDNIVFGGHHGINLGSHVESNMLEGCRGLSSFIRGRPTALCGEMLILYIVGVTLYIASTARREMSVADWT